jgi:ACT domain-containing protein
MEEKKAVVSVLGKDRKGITALVTNVLYKNDANILDISQTIISGYFTMVLIADISGENCDFDRMGEELNALAKTLNVQIRLQRSEIFDSMYRI